MEPSKTNTQTQASQGHIPLNPAISGANPAAASPSSANKPEAISAAPTLVKEGGKSLKSHEKKTVWENVLSRKLNSQQVQPIRFGEYLKNNDRLKWVRIFRGISKHTDDGTIPQRIAKVFNETIAEPLRKAGDLDEQAEFIRQELEKLDKDSIPLNQYPSGERRDTRLKLEGLQLSNRLQKALKKEGLSADMPLTAESNQKLESILRQVGLYEYFDVSERQKEHFHKSQFFILSLANDDNLPSCVRLKCLQKIRTERTDQAMQDSDYYALDDALKQVDPSQAQALAWYALHDESVPDVVKLRARRLMVCHIGEKLIEQGRLSGYDRLEAAYTVCQSLETLKSLLSDKLHPVDRMMKDATSYSSQEILKFVKEHNCRLELISSNQGPQDISVSMKDTKQSADCYFWSCFSDKLRNMNDQTALLEILDFLDCDSMEKALGASEWFQGDFLARYNERRNDPDPELARAKRLKAYMEDPDISLESRLNHYFPYVARVMESDMQKVILDFRLANRLVKDGLSTIISTCQELLPKMAAPFPLTLNFFESLKKAHNSFCVALYSQFIKCKSYVSARVEGIEYLKQVYLDANARSQLWQADYLIRLYSSNEVSSALKKEFQLLAEVNENYRLEEKSIEALIKSIPEGPEKRGLQNRILHKLLSCECLSVEDRLKYLEAMQPALVKDMGRIALIKSIVSSSAHRDFQKISLAMKLLTEVETDSLRKNYIKEALQNRGTFFIEGIKTIDIRVGEPNKRQPIIATIIRVLDENPEIAKPELYKALYDLNNNTGQVMIAAFKKALESQTLGVPAKLEWLQSLKTFVGLKELRSLKIGILKDTINNNDLAPELICEAVDQIEYIRQWVDNNVKHYSYYPAERSEIEAMRNSGQMQLSSALDNLIFNPEAWNPTLAQQCIDRLSDKGGYQDLLAQEVAARKSHTAPSPAPQMQPPVARAMNSQLIAPPVAVPKVESQPIANDIKDVANYTGEDLFSLLRPILNSRVNTKTKMNATELKIVKEAIDKAFRTKKIDEGVVSYLNGKIDVLQQL